MGEGTEPGGNLLAWLEQEERLARWESVPAEAREELLEQLARLMLKAVRGEAGDEAGNAGPGTAP